MNAEERVAGFLSRLKDAGRFDELYLGGLELKRAELGRVVCTLRVPRSLTNSYGTLHGGAIASLIDGISTCALITLGGDNPGFSIDLNITYVGAARMDEELEIDAKVLKAGKNIIMLSTELKKPSGEILASGRHTKYLANKSTFGSRL